MNKRTKNFISFFVSAFIVLSVSVSAFADPVLGALIGALDGIGVIVGGSGLTPVLIEQEVGDPTRTDVPIEIGPSTIRVNHHAETIDGVDYDAIWFSPEYAAWLKDEGLGWIADNSIDPNSSGTIAAGLGTVFGIPVYNIDGSIRSQNITFSGYAETVLGDLSIAITEHTTNYPYIFRVYYNGSELGSNVTAKETELPFTFYVSTRSLDGNYPGVYRATNAVNRYSTGSSSAEGVVVDSPFTFNYVAGNIDYSQLDGQSLKLLVPSGYLEDVEEGTYPVEGGTAPSSPVEAINDAILDALIHLEELIGEFIEDIPPTPPPTPTPLPTDALGNVPYPTWMDTFGSAVKQGIENINDTVGLFKQDVVDFFDTVGQGIQTAIDDVYDLVGLFKQEVLDTLDTWGQAIEDGLENLGDIFNTGITTLRGILEAIRTAVASITSTLTDVLEHIKQGHLDLFQPVFDGIKIVFAPVLLLLKSALRLWHYVVEWVQATAPVFSTFFGFMSGTNYNMVLPIYAALAGPICIAIYKRFGR